jgi:sugar/nucleoside kinase (ribokinase family)
VQIFPLPVSGHGGGIPDFLAIGHVTRDVQQDGSFTLGGTVTFAALTAYRLELAAAIVTCADEHLAAALPTLLPSIDLAVHLSSQSTTFANSYAQGFRTQYLKARADALDAEDVPLSWRHAPIVLLGPLAQELPPDFVSLFPRRQGALIAATPQGWLRHWDDDGRVWPTPWIEAEQILPYLDVLILSSDDLLPFANGDRSEKDAILSRWSQHVPILVATDGRYGATLFQNGQSERFAAYQAKEIDPTGAGDVFAAAFLYSLHTHGDPRQAVNFANCTASFSIEQIGTTGIPTLDMVRKRLRVPWTR